MNRNKIVNIVVHAVPNIIPIGLAKRVSALEERADTLDSSRKTELVVAKEKQNELDVRLDAIEAEARLQRLTLEVTLRLDAKGVEGAH